jgi:hypothetical protein
MSLSMLWLLQVIYLLYCPCILFGSGLWFLDETTVGNRPGALSRVMAVGIAVHCVGLMMCYALTQSLWMAVIATGGFGIWKGNKSFYTAVLERWRSLTLPCVAWLFVWVVIGISLFDYRGDITTPWRNNYGDLAFHMGMITSFSKGLNSAFTYHIFPGEILSYPFLPNLWTAALWLSGDSYRYLSIVFAFQFTLLGALVFGLLNGNRNVLLPWVLLFAGGSFATWNKWSWDFIEKGHPWTSALSTVWVTQRTALYGIVLVLLVSREVMTLAYSNRQLPKWSVARWGALLGLGLLLHTHSVITAVSFCSGLLLLRMVESAVKGNRNEVRFVLFNRFLPFVYGLSTMALFMPFLMGKKSMLKLMAGWDGHWHDGINPIASFEWLLKYITSEFAGWLVLLGVLLLFARKRMPVVVVLLGFVAAHCVLMAAWPWDQIKIFLALYAISLQLWAVQSRRFVKATILLGLVLCAPAAHEAMRIVELGESYSVYSAEMLKQAKQIEAATKPSDIIVGNSSHNSVVTLTGRKLYFGFEGTLASHTVDYQARKETMRSPLEATNCKSSETSAGTACPDYLLWTPDEQRFWVASTPGVCFEAVPGGLLYKRIKNCH